MTRNWTAGSECVHFDEPIVCFVFSFCFFRFKVGTSATRRTRRRCVETSSCATVFRPTTAVVAASVAATSPTWTTLTRWRRASSSTTSWRVWASRRAPSTATRRRRRTCSTATSPVTASRIRPPPAPYPAPPPAPATAPSVDAGAAFWRSPSSTATPSRRLTSKGKSRAGFLCKQRTHVSSIATI